MTTPSRKATRCCSSSSKRSAWAARSARAFMNTPTKANAVICGPVCGRNWPASDDQPDFGDVKNRLALAQALEAVRSLEEGVLEDIREGDVGAILGWGFMPWSGGPLSWLDMLGSAPCGPDLRRLGRQIRRAFCPAGSPERPCCQRRELLRSVCPPKGRRLTTPARARFASHPRRSLVPCQIPCPPRLIHLLAYQAGEGTSCQTGQNTRRS